MEENNIVYLFFKQCAYHNADEAFIKKYDDNPNSQVICIGVDDNPWPDGTYYDIFGNEALGDLQFIIITDYATIVDNDWRDDFRYICTPIKIKKLKELKIIS